MISFDQLKFRTTAAPLAALVVAAWVICPTTSNAWSYKEAAAPYKGTTITVLDEVTPLQLEFAKLVPEFVEETGIDLRYELLNHFDVISKGQADMLSGRGEYDAILLHSGQMGILLDADVLRPFDDLIANDALTSPDIDLGDLIEPVNSTATKFQGKTYGFNTWSYNQVYWARGDLLNHPEEQAAFKERYGYDLGPAETFGQMRDIAEFFTRKRGEKLAGEVLEADFFGFLLEGIKGGGGVMQTVWNSFMKNWGGSIFDENGRPDLVTPENLAAVSFWAELWNYAPPGTAEASFIDVATLMGQGVTAQAIAWSDFALGIDRPANSPHSGNFVYGPLPRNENYDGPRSVETEPSLLVISKASENVEPVYLFLQWMIDKKTQEKLALRLDGGVPVRYSSLELPVYKDSRLAPLYEAMLASLETGGAKPRVPQLFEIYDVFGSIMQEVGIGKLTPEEGLNKAQEEMLAICEKCTL